MWGVRDDAATRTVKDPYSFPVRLCRSCASVSSENVDTDAEFTTKRRHRS